MVNLSNISSSNGNEANPGDSLNKLLSQAVAVAQGAREQADKADKLCARAEGTATQASIAARDARIAVNDLKKQLSHPNLSSQARAALQAQLRADEPKAKSLEANASQARQVASQIVGRAADLNGTAAQAELAANQVAQNANVKPPFKLRATKFPDTFQTDSRMMAQRKLLLGGYARRVA